MVVLIIGILAAVTTSTILGKAEQAKWSEAAAAAGAIRASVRAYHAEDSVAAEAMVGSTVDTVQETLGFVPGDLIGTYFDAGNFTITDIDDGGNATIAVAAPAGLNGTAILDDDGWEYIPDAGWDLTP